MNHLQEINGNVKEIIYYKNTLVKNPEYPFDRISLIQFLSFTGEIQETLSLGLQTFCEFFFVCEGDIRKSFIANT